jgi:hypothetical protein
VWIGPVVYAFLGLVLIFIVLKVIGYFMRRAYNLTPAGTAKSKNVQPDFLKVDHAQRERMLDRGRQFDAAMSPPVESAASVTKWGMFLSGIISFGSAVFFALGRIEDAEHVWNQISAWDRFVLIVQTYPVGFSIAVIMIIGALAQLFHTLRQA